MMSIIIIILKVMTHYRYHHYYFPAVSIAIIKSIGGLSLSGGMLTRIQLSGVPKGDWRMVGVAVRANLFVCGCDDG